MKIRIIGDLHPELRLLGLKPGDEFEASLDTQSETGLVHVVVSHVRTTINCSIWPENYEIIENTEKNKTYEKIN